MILAISHAEDEHAAAVLGALRRLGAEAALVDLADFPARARLSFGAGPGAEDALLEGPGWRVRARDVRAVWWRRPRPPAPDPGLSAADAAFALRQSESAFLGVAAALRVPWVNDPWRDAAASHKPLQLAAAQRAGLAVPATLVTNDPARARAFLVARGAAPAVHKALHATARDWRPTRLVGRVDRERLDAVRLAPVVLQEYVPGVDVRVTAVGRRLFAAEIDARDTASPEDFRPVVAAARVGRCRLPAPVARRLRALVSGLGLSFAAIDLRRRDDGEHVFLEVNPSGQWNFVEERAGLPITDAVAALLAGG